jgi:tetratricopeptide (TPR) repeat protein
MRTGIAVLTLAFVAAFLQTANIQAQSTNPTYLAQFPSVERIKADVRGVDAMETAAKQAGVFWQLHQLIYNLAYSQRRTDRQFSPDEQRMSADYRNACYVALQTFEGKVSGADKSRWFELHTKYEIDLWLLDEVMKRYFTPELRKAVYVALKGEMPTTDAPETSRLTPPAGSSTAGTNPRRTSGSTSPTAQPGAATGRLYYDAAGNWKYQDQFGGVYDKNGYTWADGSLTTNSGYQVKANQPNIIDNGDGTKTDLSKSLGRPVTLQEARQVAISSEESLQDMGYSQPNTPEAVIAKLENRSTNAPAVKSNSTSPRAGPKTTSQPSQPSTSAGLSAEAYADQGSQLFDAKNYAQSIEAYKKALAVNPSLRRGYLGLALAYEAQKQWQSAIENRQKALALKPDDANSLGLLANDYFFNKEYQRSVAAAKQYIALRPNDPVGFLQLAVAYRAAEQFPEAIEGFRAAIRLNPEKRVLSLVYSYLGHTYLQVGKKQDALQIYEALKPLDPEKAQALYDSINKPQASSSSQEMSKSIQTKPLPATADAAAQKLWVRAKAGNVDAQNSLGWKYQNGLNGMSADMAEARKWYRLAAAQGNASGKVNLCKSYAEELHISDDSDNNPSAPIRALRGSKTLIAEAFKSCGVAANIGLTGPSKYILGVLYAKGGPGLEPNYEEAYFWLSMPWSEDVLRDKVGKKLTPERRAEIKQRADAWKPPTP